MLTHLYRGSPHWQTRGRELDPVLNLFATTDKTAEVAKASTRLLLHLCGWTGTILRSSHLPIRPGRSRRSREDGVAHERPIDETATQLAGNYWNFGNLQGTVVVTGADPATGIVLGLPQGQLAVLHRRRSSGR